MTETRAAYYGDLIPREVLDEMRQHIGNFTVADVHLQYKDGVLLNVNFVQSIRHWRRQGGAMAEQPKRKLSTLAPSGDPNASR